MNSPLPMVVLAENSGYSIEGFAEMDHTGLPKDVDLPFDFINEEEVSEINNLNSYEEHFFGKEHFNFIGKSHDLNDFCLSIKFEKLFDESFLRYVLRCLITTKREIRIKIILCILN